jgi:hypothetical protein
MVQETAPASKRRVNGHGRVVRRARIFARMREGRSYAAIAGEDALTPRRVRQIVSEALQRRIVDSASDHALLQLERPVTKSHARGQRKPSKRRDSEKEKKANAKVFLWRTAFRHAPQTPKSG